MAAWLRTIHSVNDYVASAIGMVFNLLLILLIIRDKNPELKKYNQILLQCTYIDICLLVISFIGKPILIVFGDNVAILSTPIIPLLSPYFFGHIWIFFILHSILNIPITFYYRYCVLVKEKEFSLKLQIICLSIIGISTLSLFATFYYTLYYRAKGYFHIAEQLAPWLADDDGLVKAVAIGGSFDLTAYAIYSIHSVIVIMGFYFFAIWCNFKVLRYLKEKTKITMVFKTSRPSFVEIQNQISNTLIAQAVIPLFTFAFPVIFVVISVLSPFKVNPIIASSFSIMLTYIPTGNAFSILFFVKSYRKRGLGLIKNGITHFFKHQTSSIASAH